MWSIASAVVGISSTLRRRLLSSTTSPCCSPRAQDLCRRRSSTGEEPSQGRLLRIICPPGRASRDLRVVPSTSFVPRVEERRPREEDRAAEEGNRSTCTFTSGNPERPCVNPVFSDQQFVKDCPKTCDDLNKSLLEEHLREEEVPGRKNLGDHRQSNRAGAESPHYSAFGQARRDTGRTPWLLFRVSH